MSRPVPRSRRPTPEEIAQARDRRIRDVIADDLLVLFCGINPGLYSGATGHHFARPGNRFWKALHGAGFTREIVSPYDDATLLADGLGITNLVERTTATAAELTHEELRRGAERLERKVRRRRPAIVAILGVDAYRKAFDRPHATGGPQGEGIDGAALWVLPNPSGLNAHYQLPALVEEFSKLRRAATRIARAKRAQLETS